jgi:hypothetical protein
VGNAPDNGLRFSFQSPDANGMGNGVDQFATIASGSVTTGFLDPGAFDANRSVTRGDYLVMVCDFPSFVAADSVTVQSWTPFGGNTANFPFGISATNTVSVVRIPQYFLHYTDSGGFWACVCPWMIPAISTTTSSIDTGTTPNEIGLKFQVPFPCKLSEFMGWITMTAAGSDFDFILYDAGSTPVATLSQDGDYKAGATSLRLWHLWLQTEYTLTANTIYRLIIKPTTTNNIALAYYVFPSQLAAMIPGGANWCLTQRTGGAWTDFNNGTDGYRQPCISLGFTAFDDAASAGGGLIRNPGMSGGII